MKGLIFRSNDAGATVRMESILSRRRVRGSDNGDDSMNLQAMRCQAQLKADTYRTVATWTGSAMLVVVGGVMAGTYALVKDSATEIRRDVSVIVGGHQHDDNVRVRELNVLRDSITLAMRDISEQIKGIADDIGNHVLIDKHAGAMPLPAPNRSGSKRAAP